MSQQDPYILLIDYRGSLYKLHLETCTYECIVECKESSRKNTIKRTTTCPTCAWAIGGDQNVCMMVFDTDSPITVQEHCYENQRWFIRHGWSQKSMIVTDRWKWSSKDGKRNLPKESFILPNACWQWEGDWFVDYNSIDCDNEGWEYAIDFPFTYSKQQGRSTCVRRKRWARSRKFVGFNEWIVIPSVLSDDPFHDIAIGGSDIPGQSEGFLSVWAITFAGKVFFREGITRTSPEGLRWVAVESEDLNLVQISVSTTGVLCGCSWDGSLVIREGVNHVNVIGTSWSVHKSPSKAPLTQVSVGTYSLWALDQQNKVYFYRGLQNAKKKNTENGVWVDMVGLFDLIAVSPNDQVFVLSAKDRCIHVRTGITKDELVGRTWKILETNFEDDIASHCSWIDSGSCTADHKSVESFGRCSQQQDELQSASSFRIFEWRNTILKDLCQRNKIENNEKENGVYTRDSTKWDKRHSCKCLTDQYYDIWSDAYLKLSLSVGNNQIEKPLLYVYYTLKTDYKEWVLPLENISCIHRLKHATRKYIFTILSAYTQEVEIDPEAKPSKTTTSEIRQDVIIDLGDEKNLKEWMSVLAPQQTLEEIEQPSNNSTHHENDTKTEQNMMHTGENHLHTLWATTVLGEIYRCTLSNDAFVNKRFTDFHWTNLAGHLKQVVSNGSGTVWGFGFDGKAYTFLPHTPHMFENKSVEEHVIYENQRWNPIEGYSGRLLPSDRWGWSCVKGYTNCAKDKYTLPYSNYKWIEEWQVLYDPDNCDNDGWHYAIDFPSWYHKHRGMNDYVRRRRWKRKCEVTTRGFWREIQTDVKILDLSVSMETDAVWAVSCKGKVMYRNGISPEQPQGTSWSHVPTNCTIRSISVGAKNRVWCVATDGSCYMRAGFMNDVNIGTHWFHIPKDTQPVAYISAGKNLIIGVDAKGTAYYRCDVTSSYPEGTRWQMLWKNVENVSVNILDQVAFTRNGNIVICMDVLNDRENCVVVEMLLDGWLTSCCRGVLGTIQTTSSSNSLSQLASTVTDGESNAHADSDGDDEVSDGEAPSEILNPYAIDIYSFYGKGPASSEEIE